MSDTTRGLIIGVFVGLIGGMMVGAMVVSLIREYSTLTGFTGFLIDYGQIIFVLIGAVTGGIGSYRMLQTMQQEGEEEV